MDKAKSTEKNKKFPWGIILKTLSFIIITLAILIIGLYSVMWVVVKGPSPTAKQLFVRSVKETSAIGFFANIYLSNEEIAEIMGEGKQENKQEQTDTSLISIKKPETLAGENPAEGDKPAQKDLELLDIKGPSFKGKLMIIKDPQRTFLATTQSYGGAGEQLDSMVERTGAIAGVNGGGFDDPGGGGQGGIPEGIVIRDGQLLSSDAVNAKGYWTAVMDKKGILHVGWMTGYQAAEKDANWAVSFGPVLVQNGKKFDGLNSGLNPRTAVGQREDGAVLLLVIEGRHVDSLGATCSDIADIMLQYGAVNAMNLDGGSSSAMIYNGEQITSIASVVGVRPIPTAILVKQVSG